MSRSDVLKTASIILVALSTLYAAEKVHTTGKILKVEQKVNTRVLYYMVNTPVTKDEPYYEVTVQLKDTIYLGRYTPRHADDTLPEEWQTSSSVQARVEGRNLFLQRPSGSDMEFVIVKRSAVKSQQQVSEPTPPK